MWSRDRFSRATAWMAPNLNMSKFGSNLCADSISTGKPRVCRTYAARMPRGIHYHDCGSIIHFARTVAPSNDVIPSRLAPGCLTASMRSFGGLRGLCAVYADDVALFMDYIILPGVGWADAAYRPHTTVFGCEFCESGWRADFSWSFLRVRGHIQDPMQSFCG